jgi:zinc protease
MKSPFKRGARRDARARVPLAAILIMLAMASAHLGQQQQPLPETPPPPAAPRPVTVPKAVEKTLRNGLRVIVLEQRRVPLVTVEMVIKNGGEVDPPELSGVADMTAVLLTKGTRTRTAPEIARAIEALGGSLETSAEWDASLASINVMSNRIAPALAILADLIRRPVFTGREIERLRQQYLDDLQLDFGEPGTLADYVASRVVFGDAPYGHPLAGTPESLARIKRRDIVRIHAKYYRPDNAILVFGGDIEPAAAFRLAERSFGDWPRPARPLIAASVPSTERPVFASGAAPRVVVVDMPDAGQAAVMLARRGMRRSDPGYFSGEVANSVLGGGYSSRLNQEIRIKRGLSYSADSSLDAMREQGIFVASAQTRNESGAEVAALLIGELRRLSSDPTPESELTPRKAALIGSFARSLETTDGLAAQIATLALYGLSLDRINTYIGEVRSVTSGDVRKIAGTSLDAGSAHIVIVGNARLFLEPLGKLFPNVEVIPVTDLDLNSSTLRKAHPRARH